MSGVIEYKHPKLGWVMSRAEDPSPNRNRALYNLIICADKGKVNDLSNSTEAWGEDQYPSALTLTELNTIKTNHPELRERLNILIDKVDRVRKFSYIMVGHPHPVKMVLNNDEVRFVYYI